MGHRHRDLRTAVPSARLRHLEHERVLAEVEVGLGLYASPALPCVGNVSIVGPYPVVPKVDAVDLRKHRVKLDARIGNRDKRLEVARVERLVCPAVELDVLLRHSRSPSTI